METGNEKKRLGEMSSFQEWLLDSLKTLSHPDPLSVCQCIGISPGTKKTDSSFINVGSSASQQQDMADLKFRQLVIWLEDYIIRLWDETNRQEILYYNNSDDDKAYPTKDEDDFFWEQGLPKYVSDLNCPKIYYCFEESCKESSDNHKSLRYNKFARKRVLHWIICCAISDAYGDIISKDRNIGHTSSETLTAINLPPFQNFNEITNTTDNYDLDFQNFPLGFTTNNNLMDEIAKVMRMKYIYKMREFQNEILKKVEDKQLQSIESKEQI